MYESLQFTNAKRAKYKFLRKKTKNSSIQTRVNIYQIQFSSMTLNELE